MGWHWQFQKFEMIEKPTVGNAMKNQNVSWPSGVREFCETPDQWWRTVTGNCSKPPFRACEKVEVIQPMLTDSARSSGHTSLSQKHTNS
jgi:hypothetical protein